MRFISRSEWGARAPRSVSRVTWPHGTTLHCHHTTGTTPPASATQAQEAALVRGYQRYHMDVNGWADLGYSYLVAPSGRVYEGRGRNVRGAHSPSKNHEPSVALIGTYQTVEPTDAQHRAVWELADMIGATRLAGHRDSSATACPGDAAYRKIVKGPRPAKPSRGTPQWNTLRVAIRPPGGEARQWAGRAAQGPVVWLSRNSLRPDATAAIAYAGNVWRDHADIRNVAINLTRRFF